jgi:putative ABC transport system permease protein
LIESRKEFGRNWPAADDIEELSEELAEEPEPSLANRSRRSFIWLQAFAFLLGLGLLIYVINRVGVQPLFDALLRIGFGFFVILGLSGLRHFLRTISMRAAVPPEHRQISFRHAFSARLGGEAISFLTFTGPLLGEATKVALLRKRVPLTYGVPALVVDNLLYNLSVVFFVLTGAMVMLLRYPLPPRVYVVLVGIAVVAALGIAVAAFAAKRRVMLLTWFIDRTAQLRLSPKVILKRRDHIYHIESKVYDFYKHHPGAFYLMIACNLVAHAASVIEVYLALRFLGFRPDWSQSYIIESLTKVINFAFSFVPGTIGVYEGGTEVILQKGLGFEPAAGLALALVRKAAIVFWTSIGLLVLTWRTLPNAWQRVLDRSPRLQRLMDSLVFSNIAHRPARTAVSILGTAVGVLLIVFTVGLANGVLHERGRRESNIGAEIMIRASGSIGLGAAEFRLPAEFAGELASIPGVRAATPVGQTLDKSDSGFGQRLIDGIRYDEYATLTRITIREGRKLESGDEAIIDPEWQRSRNAKVGDTVKLFERAFKIVGVYEPPGGGRIKIPLETMQEQEGTANRVSVILIACDDPAKQDEVAARILQRFPEGYQLLFTRDLPEIYASGVPALNVFIKVVVGVAAAISMLVILLAMYTTVTERTRQIGILKSLGMSKTSIAWVIEQEAIIVSFLGVAVGVGLTLLARLAVMRTTSLTIEIEPRWILIALAVGLVGGSIGALYPALRAARQDAVDALSYE